MRYKISDLAKLLDVSTNTEKLFTLYWYKIIKFSEIFGRQLAFYIAV